MKILLMKTVFLHGFLGGPKDWEGVLAHLHLPYECLKLPGHGGQPLEEAITEKVILVGYSLGGRLAMQFANQFPERVEKLILLSANPGLESGKKKRILQDERWAKCLENEGIDRFLETWYSQSLFSTLKLEEERLKWQRKLDPIELAKVLRTLSPAKLPNLWPNLKKNSFRVVFLFGENDIKYKSIGRRLEKNFKVGWVPRCGHAIHLENPKACAESIYEFSSS